MPDGYPKDLGPAVVAQARQVETGIASVLRDLQRKQEELDEHDRRWSDRAALQRRLAELPQIASVAAMILVLHCAATAVINFPGS